MISFLLTLIDEADDKLFFEDLYNGTKHTAFKAAFSVLRDYGDAEDCVQNTFVYIARHFNSVKMLERDCIEGFVACVSECRAIAMQNEKKHTFFDGLFDTQSDGDGDDGTAVFDGDGVLCEDEYYRYYSTERIFLALESLSDEYRLILYLRYIYRCSSREIGAVIGCSDACARKHLQFARKKLKAILEEGES